MKIKPVDLFQRKISDQKCNDSRTDYADQTGFYIVIIQPADGIEFSGVFSFVIP